MSETCLLCPKIEPWKCLRYEMATSRKWRDIWCPYYSCEVQTCVISSHEKLEIKISSWRFYLVLETCDLRQSANASNNSNLNFGHRYKRIFKCLNQYVMTGFFLSVFRPRTDINNKTVPRCYAARRRFSKLVLYQLFHFRQESCDDFF